MEEARTSLASRGRVLECRICWEFKGERRQTEIHYLEHHTPQAKVPWYCRPCGVRYTRHSSLASHISRRHKGQEARAITGGTGCFWALPEEAFRTLSEEDSLAYYRSRRPGRESKPATPAKEASPPRECGGLPTSPDLDLPVQEFLNSQKPLRAVSPLPPTPPRPVARAQTTTPETKRQLEDSREVPEKQATPPPKKLKKAPKGEENLAETTGPCSPKRSISPQRSKKRERESDEKKSENKTEKKSKKKYETKSEKQSEKPPEEKSDKKPEGKPERKTEKKSKRKSEKKPGKSPERSSEDTSEKFSGNQSQELSEEPPQQSDPPKSQPAKTCMTICGDDPPQEPQSAEGSTEVSPPSGPQTPEPPQGEVPQELDPTNKAGPLSCPMLPVETPIPQEESGVGAQRQSTTVVQEATSSVTTQLDPPQGQELHPPPHGQDPLSANLQTTMECLKLARDVIGSANQREHSSQDTVTEAVRQLKEVLEQHTVALQDLTQRVSALEATRHVHENEPSGENTQARRLQRRRPLQEAYQRRQLSPMSGHWKPQGLPPCQGPRT